METYMENLLKSAGVTSAPWAVIVATLSVTILICVIIYLIWRYVVLGAVKRYNKHYPRVWVTELLDSNVFTHLVLVIQGVIVNVQVRLWVPSNHMVYNVLEVATRLWIMVFAFMAALAFINLVIRMTQSSSLSRKIPVQGIAQAVKLILFVVFVILLVSVLLGRSPALLLSGLGAMTAVFMLVFKDPIMGFVSGLQLSTYNLLSVGDWVEMPKYNADGDVLEIGLTTVKVQNWDKTIVTIPTYALMSDSFKNWRGMQDAGGRRIKRSVNIDVSSIHFLSREEYDRLKKAYLITGYLEKKNEEIQEFNKTINADMDFNVNGRHLTNVGTFRAYLQSYLQNNPNIHQGMTLMVRQLAPTSEGLPVEIYCFTSTTAWAAYEGIQSDIFDHIYAVLPEFNLRAYQSPTGHDMQCMAGEARTHSSLAG